MRSGSLLIFLDIDGVLNDHSCGKILPEQVKWLNYALAHQHHNVEIIFNTSWNSNTLDYMVKAMTAAGFKYPSCLVGQTDSNAGGGNPVRRWLTEHKRIGDRYIIIDDSTHDYDEMWGRLVHCNYRVGFNKDLAKKFHEMTWRRISDDRRERDAAVANLVLEAQRTAYRTDWLTVEQRRGYIDRTMELIAHILTVPDFLEAAYLKEPSNGVLQA